MILDFFTEVSFFEFLSLIVTANRFKRILFLVWRGARECDRRSDTCTKGEHDDTSMINAGHNGAEG